MRILILRPNTSRVASLTAAVLIITTAAFLPLTPKADALAGADFRAGRIIDNAIFYNDGAMSVQAIQEFLNRQVPVCDTSGSKPSEFGGGTRAQYGSSQGYPPPYVCLKDFQQNPQTGDSNYGGNPVPPGAKTAAQIIHDAGRAYGINPQVLLVTMQAESGIVTDDWPWASQYRTAMGYGCPDSAPCDAAYYGFSNQVNNAAQQLRRYATNPNSFNFVGGSWANVRFSPNASCGSGSVFIENQATAALYNYTPYQPNQAALNNLFGSGDGCSSYRNRNFWRIFNTWFGSTWTNERGTDLGEAQNRIYPIEYNGELYVFYYDAFRRALRMAHAHPTNGWQFSILDGEGGSDGRIKASVGSSLAVTIYNNALHLFYYDKSNGNLRHGSYNGSSWQFFNLDGDPGSFGGRDTNLGTNPSATVYNGTLQVVYYDRSSANLRHAWHDGANWQFENLDGDRGSISGVEGQLGAFSTLASYNGTLQLFYYDQMNARLKHAWITNTTGWRFEDFDGPRSVSGYGGLVGISPIAVPIGDALQVFYYDEGRTNVRHAWATSQHGWRFEDLDGDGNTAVSRRLLDVGQTISATKLGDHLHLFYYDRLNGNVRHAWTSQTGWNFENIDGDPGSIGGQNADMGIHSGVTPFWTDSLQLYYYNRSNGSFRHAWTNDNRWNFEDLGPSVSY